MRFRKSKVFKSICFSLIFSFLTGSLGQAAPLNLPNPQEFIPLSSAYSFPVLKGLKFDPANPLKMEFIVDTGDKKDISQQEAGLLIKYFLAGLTTPEKDIWVNLSPYEQDRIIPEGLGQTELGKDLLSQDYLLKQLTSSLTYPESDTGKDYWEKTYAEVMKIAKTTKLPVNTFNKVWITPDEAEVYENGNAGFITKATLKIMLEEDYLALKNKVEDIKREKKNLDNNLIEKINKASSMIIKEIVLPKINTEINSGKNFATLRQIYYSLILGLWFKQKFQNSIYQHYINQNKLKGIDLEDKTVKEKIYQHYVQAFKTGLYNYIRPERELASGRVIKRQYFSGGFGFTGLGENVNIGKVEKGKFDAAVSSSLDKNDIRMEIRFNEPPDIVKSGSFPLSDVEQKFVDDLFGNDQKIDKVSDTLPNGYTKHFIDAVNSGDKAKNKLKEYFSFTDELGKDGEKFYLLSFHGAVVALVRDDGRGKRTIKKLVDGLRDVKLEQIVENAEAFEKQGKGVIDVILEDYLFFEERAKISINQKNTLTWRELKEHQKEFDQKKADYELRIGELEKNGPSGELEGLKAEYVEFKKNNPDGLQLAGGKGLSLALCDEVEDVPVGFIVTTNAYFKFIKANPKVYDLIDNELKKLDTMDDQKRDVVARDIRQAMQDGSIPEDIERELSVMYRHLNILRAHGGKKTPTAVAVRSSGLKEDINVQTWLPITTGSQAGQSDTYLNVRGLKNVLEKLKSDWASLFTDRAVSYRDDAIFLIFSGVMGFEDKQPKQVYYNLLAKLREYSSERQEFNLMADTLTNLRNPGSVNLMGAMEFILSQEKNSEIESCLEKMRQIAQEFVHPEQIGIGVVIMQMVNSYLSGVAFTVNPASKMAGVSQALYRLWHMNNDSLVYKDKNGKVIGTKPIVVSYEISFGYGENVVGGKVNPDKIVMGTYDGVNWFIIEKIKGSKLIQMVDIEDAFALLKNKISEEEIRKLSAVTARAVSYDEVSKVINGILTTRLSGVRYLKAARGKKQSGESDRDREKRLKELLKKIAEDIAGKIKNGESQEKIKEFIKDNFVVAAKASEEGIKESTVDDLIGEAIKFVGSAKIESEAGEKELNEYLNFGQEGAKIFIEMIKEAWGSDKKSELSYRSNVLNRLKLDEKELKNFSYLVRALIDKSFTCNVETADAHRDSFVMEDGEFSQVARMVWNLAVYYGDQRDVEFAIEIDHLAAGGKRRLNLIVLDKEGNILTVEDGKLVKSGKTISEPGKEGRVISRLYNVQARPYTADYNKVDYTRKGTEIDQDFVERNNLKPIAIGTKGANAVFGYVFKFDMSKSIAWHADEIRRLKRGDFTQEEKEKIRQAGFNPDDYGADSKEKLPIVLYLLEADPSHDPLMRLVDAVVTKRGGDTCHAAIFCREQGIPAVAGAGEVSLNNRFLKTGDGLTVDANNGRLFKEKIPIKFVEFRIKPYAIPEDDDGLAYPKVGMVLAATNTAQQIAAIMLSPDASGVALTRIEFKGEELGIHPFAGYGYDRIQEINNGTLPRPRRISIEDIAAGRIDHSAQEFVSQINNDIYDYFDKYPGSKAEFNKVFNRNYIKDDGIFILTAFGPRKADEEENHCAKFIKTLPKDAQDLLGYIYGTIERRFNFDLNVIESLEVHPWVLDEIKAKLKEKGYKTFGEYARKEFYYFFNLMGFTVAADQKVKVRAYDFAQDKTKGLIGWEIFSTPGINPLVGHRGTGLEIEGVGEYFEGNQKVLGFYLEEVVNANENTHNQAWFNVFIRFPREMEALDLIMQRTAEKKNKLPKQIGIMIEVPSAAIYAEEFAKKMIKMKEKYTKYGVELTFFSFGTNDYSHLAGQGDREDPRMKLKILDPAALMAAAEIAQEGYFYNKETNQLPLIDEGADVMLQLMEVVVKAADKLGIETSLCGEAITTLAGRGNFEAAGKIMSMLKSFGVSMMSVRLLVSMIRYDVMAATKEITAAPDKREILFDLKAGGEVFPKAGVVKGEIIYIDSANDLKPHVLKRLSGEELVKERESLKIQSLKDAQSTVRTHHKIVVITKNLAAMERRKFLEKLTEKQFRRFVKRGLIKDLGRNRFIWANLDSNQFNFSIELQKQNYDKASQKNILALWEEAWNNTIAGLEKQGLDWDDLQYAKAIIVDDKVNLAGWDVFSRAKSIVPTRIKAVAPGIGILRANMEGKSVTINYADGKIYAGNLAIKKKEFALRSLPIPEYESKVEIRQAVKEDANNAYTDLKYHPLVLFAYKNERLADFEKTFSEYISKIIEEADGISKEKNRQKREWLLKNFSAKIASEPEKIIQDFLKSIFYELSAEKEIKPLLAELEVLKENYFTDLSLSILKLIGNEPVDEFIKDAFKRQMRKVLNDNPNNLVVHTTTSLNCAVFRNMQGGFLVEQVNPNPDYGLLGAARALGDFYEINRLELQAFKEVWESLSDERKVKFGLQIAEPRGTQSGAVMIGWKYILKDMEIIPGANGLLLGVSLGTPADTLAVDKYFKYFKNLGAGLSFVSYDKMGLGASWSGVDFSWKEGWRRLAKEKELSDIGETVVKIIKGKIADATINSEKPKFVVQFKQSEANPLMSDKGENGNASSSLREEALGGISMSDIHISAAPGSLSTDMAMPRLNYFRRGISFKIIEMQPLILGGAFGIFNEAGDDSRDEKQLVYLN